MSQTLLLGRKLNDDIVLPFAVDASGFLMVNNTNPVYMQTIQDVSLNGVANRDTLIYETSSSLWKNGKLNYSDLSGTPSLAINDLTDVTITSVATNQILKYNSTAWVNSSSSLPDFLSYTFPSVSQNLGVATLATARKTNSVIDLTETLNDFTGLACNTFRITGLTNAVYKITAIMGFRRTTAADVSFFCNFYEGNSATPVSNTNIALTTGSCYAANTTNSCSISMIRDYRTTLPTYLFITFQNQTAEAAQLVRDSNFITIERLYNVF